jgi:hypothetical protein
MPQITAFGIVFKGDWGDSPQGKSFNRGELGQPGKCERGNAKFEIRNAKWEIRSAKCESEIMRNRKFEMRNAKCEMEVRNALRDVGWILTVPTFRISNFEFRIS